MECPGPKGEAAEGSSLGEGIDGEESPVASTPAAAETSVLVLGLWPSAPQHPQWIFWAAWRNRALGVSLCSVYGGVGSYKI